MIVFSIPEPWRGDRKHNELDKNHITSQSMGDSYNPITLFFEGRGVGIHNVISKNYRMGDITLISRNTCDKVKFVFITPLIDIK
jgi:hypothetical protein